MGRDFHQYVVSDTKTRLCHQNPIVILKMQRPLFLMSSPPGLNEVHFHWNTILLVEGKKWPSTWWIEQTLEWWSLILLFHYQELRKNSNFAQIQQVSKLEWKTFFFLKFSIQSVRNVFPFLRFKTPVGHRRNWLRSFCSEDSVSSFVLTPFMRYGGEKIVTELRPIESYSSKISEIDYTNFWSIVPLPSARYGVKNRSEVRYFSHWEFRVKNWRNLLYLFCAELSRYYSQWVSLRFRDALSWQGVVCIDLANYC